MQTITVHFRGGVALAEGFVRGVEFAEFGMGTNPPDDSCKAATFTF